METNTSTQCNQITSRMVTGSYVFLKDKQYVSLRYTPRELQIINISTLGDAVKIEKDIMKKKKQLWK